MACTPTDQQSEPAKLPFGDVHTDGGQPKATYPTGWCVLAILGMAMAGAKAEKWRAVIALRARDDSDATAWATQIRVKVRLAKNGRRGDDVAGWGSGMAQRL